MEIDSEDATEIVRAVRENLQRLGVPELHEEILQRIHPDEPAGQSEGQVIEPKHFLENYLVSLTWLLNAYNPALARYALQHLQRNVEGGVQGVVVDLGNDPFTGKSTAVPLQDLVPDYTAISTGMREVLASLELRYREQPAAEFDIREQHFDNEPPPL